MTLHRFEHLVGNTPLIQLEEKLFAKLETFNPSGSIKDRMVLYIVKNALQRKLIKKDTVIVEASSGNTGIALSMIGARINRKVKIIMPENMSTERKKMMRLFGAELIEVGHNDFQGAITLRDKILLKNKNYWSPLQFSNKLNIECHKMTTGPEIYADLYPFVNNSHLNFGAFVHGSGTGGTLMGVWEFFNKTLEPENRIKDVKFILTSPWETSKEHGIQGINDGANFLLNKNIINQEIKIKTNEAKEYMKTLATQKGLMVGISSAANVLASKQWLKENPDSGYVVTILCDRGERYLESL